MIQNNGVGGQDDSLTKTASTSLPPELVGSHKDLDTSSDEKNEFQISRNIRGRDWHIASTVNYHCNWIMSDYLLDGSGSGSSFCLSC